MYDVAVIGAGPVGSHLAYRLAGMGFSVAVVEKKSDLGEPVCCTGIVSQDCVNQYGIEKSVIYREVNGAALYSPSGKIIRLRRREPQAAIVERAALNVFMAQRAMDRNAEYILGSPVSNIEVSGDRVALETGKQKARNILEARVAVIASGFGSGLTDRLGIGKAGDFAMGAQAEVGADGIDEVEVYSGKKVAPGFFGWLVPTSPGRALIGLIARRRTGYYMKNLISSLFAQGKITTEGPEVSYAGLALQARSKTSGNRVIVVGSAAGQVKPTTGGGIYYGLLCADIAADYLQQALESDSLSARDLSGYDRRWRKALGREQRLGYWSRKVFELLSDRQIDRLFDIIISNGIDEALMQSDDVKFDWHGKAVLKLLGHRALSKTINAMKLPFPPGKKNS